MKKCIRQRRQTSIILVLVLAVAGFIIFSHWKFDFIQKSRRLLSMINQNESDVKGFTKNTDSPKMVTIASKSIECSKNMISDVFSNGSRSVGPDVTAAPETTSKDKKYLIYLCDKYDYCFGFADRQRGAVGVYVLSLLTNRQFGFNMSHPWAFSDFYSPNEVQWNIPENELAGKSTITVSYNRKPTLELYRIDFNKVYPQDVVFVRNKSELWVYLAKNPNYKSMIPKWAEGSRVSIIANIWLKLMKPTTELRSGLNEVLANIARSMMNTSASVTNSSNAGALNQTLAPSLQPQMTLEQIYDLTGFRVADLGLVCVHVRIGKSNTLPRDSDVRNRVETVSAVWNFLKAYVEKGHHVYLATDNIEIRKQGKKEFGLQLHLSESPVLHVDKVTAGQELRKGMKLALLEQLLLMTSCEVLVVSYSGYSMIASYVRAKLIGYKNNYMFRNASVSNWILW